MGERVTISYRGAAYELGRGKRYYAIWAAETPRSEPVERWPETPEGWVAAWTRFIAMETPGTIAPVGKHQVPSQTSPSQTSPGEPGADEQAGSETFAGPGAFAGPAGETVAFGRQTLTSGRTALGSAGSAFAVALLGIGVICGLVGLFPHYQVGASLTSQPSLLVPHVAYLAVWTLAGLLIALRAGAVARAGALLAVGTSAVTFGLFLADLGYGFSTADAGLWISLVGWLACTAGAVLAFRTTAPGTVDRRPGPRGLARAAVLIVAGVGVALSYFPNWDSYLGLSSTLGQSQAVGSGFAFANTIPGWVQVGNAAIMVLFVLIVVAAALWRPLVAGAMLLAGAVIPMAAQAASAIIQSSEPTSPLVFGLSPSQAQQVGLRITNGLTPAFWIFCLFLVTLLVSCVWMLISPPGRSESVSAPVVPVEPATAEAAGPAGESATEPVPGLADDAWTEPELAGDSRDDRA